MILQLATRFRIAIENACENDEFNKYYPFNKFPYDCCDMTCELLAEFFHEHNIHTILVNGKHIDCQTWHHIWLQTDNNIVIDITCDQFNGENGFSDNFPKVHVGNKLQVHDKFSFQINNEERMFFNDNSTFSGFQGISNKREKDLQIMYKIIKKYL